MKYRQLSAKFLTCAVFIFFLDGYVQANGENGEALVREVEEKAYNFSLTKYEKAEISYNRAEQSSTLIQKQIDALRNLEGVVTKNDYEKVNIKMLELMKSNIVYTSKITDTEQEKGLKTLMKEALNDYKTKKQELEGARKKLNEFARKQNNNQKTQDKSIRIANGDEIASNGVFAKCETAEFVPNFARRKIILSANMIKKMAVAQCSATDNNIFCKGISQGKEDAFPSVCSTYVKCTNDNGTVLRPALCEDLDCDDVVRGSKAMDCVNDGSARGIDLDKDSTTEPENPGDIKRGSITL